MAALPRVQSKSIDTIQIYPWMSYEDISVARTPPLVRNAAEHFKRIKDLDSRDDDIMICSAPKSGTHWIHEIVSMLLSQTTEYNSMGSMLDMVLTIQEIDTINAAKGQRVMHTHLPLRFVPKQHLEKGRKIVYLNRNPKDRHVSMYNWLCGKMGVPENWTWSDYFQKHVLTDTYVGGWFNYTREMTAAVRSKSVNIIQVLYEDLFMDPKREVIRLAEFLEVAHTDEFINDVIDRCKFTNLRDHKVDITTTFTSSGTSTLFRKGKIGDWKNWFTVDQNEQFDEIYQKKMAGVDAEFIFDISNDKSTRIQ